MEKNMATKKKENVKSIKITRNMSETERLKALRANAKERGVKITKSKGNFPYDVDISF